MLPSPRRIYLQGAIASMSAAIDTNIVKMSRHDVLLRVTANGAPMEVETDYYRGPARAVALPPLQRHSVNCQGAGIVTLVVHVIHPRFRAVRAALGGETRQLDRNLFSHLDSRLHTACHGEMGVDEACDLMNDLIDILLEGHARPPPLDLRILWVMRKLDVNIDHPFETLASELGLSMSRLSHLFAEQLGLSFRSYQAWARLRQAWEMLTQRPEMSITDIAQAMGFADAAHFSRAFHGGLGFTPSILRDPGIVEIRGHGLPSGQHILLAPTEN